jgi:putative FmdB family regulatory protein
LPVYAFYCDCGKDHDEFRRLADWDLPMVCPSCGKQMRHDLAAQAGAVRGNYKKPIGLQSMGFLAVPEDVAEHRKRFPNVELKFEDGSAIPVVKSLGQKRAYLKAAGWADMRSF